MKSRAISRTKRWKGSFRMSNSVDFGYLWISRRAMVPGRYWCDFFVAVGVPAPSEFVDFFLYLLGDGETVVVHAVVAVL